MILAEIFIFRTFDDFVMAPKTLKVQKHPWRDLNYIKRKKKKLKTEAKLLKKFEREESVEGPISSEIIPAEPESKEIVTATAAEAIREPQLSTISLAVPGSIMDLCQNTEIKSHRALQIARAACIYRVDEIVVFNDTEDERMKSCNELATLLQYLECPQYLRKHFFQSNYLLRCSGLLHPLDAPHHLRAEDKFPFREGVVLTVPTKSGKGSYAEVGLGKPIRIDKFLDPFLRVTVKLETKPGSSKLRGVVVSPSTPRKESGTYWGYNVRIAKSLNEALIQSPFADPYDLTIGTSDKGDCIDDVPLEDKSFQHCLIVFGGRHGLEYALKNDKALDVDDVSVLFDYYVNTCPEQACRTIRTEEAILITLAELRKKFKKTPEAVKESNL